MFLGLAAQPPSAAVAAAPAAADAGFYTIVEGDARILRGTAWFKLAPGWRTQEGDLIEASEHAQVQVELSQGSVLNFVGPGSAYATALPAGARAAASDWTLAGGWVKAVQPSGAAPLTLRTAAGVVEVAEGIVVAASEPAGLRVFVESGSARIAGASGRGKVAPSRELHAGEYWARAGDALPQTLARVPANVVAAMPRHLLDPLPRLTARFAGPAPAPAMKGGIEASFAEAEPWLAGPHRKASSSASRRGCRTRRFVPLSRRMLPPIRSGSGSCTRRGP